jgi:hypothetical protein
VIFYPLDFLQFFEETKKSSYKYFPVWQEGWVPAILPFQKIKVLFFRLLHNKKEKKKYMKKGQLLVALCIEISIFSRLISH